MGSLIPPGARSFGKYELLARLATGGMAEIFLARRRGGDGAEPWVVIKRVLPHLAEDLRFVAMFRDEARLAARIEHVNACRVLELGSVGDTYFIAMEYLHGVPLSRVLLRAARSNERLDVPLVAAIIQQCCAGLHAAHELRSHDSRLLDVVHRDVSPPNIFVNVDGVVKLLDFGVAKARGASQKTRTGTVKGKNAYMSPEQVLGEEIDRRSDLFSLGIVMWESLTASRLFLRDTDFETFRAITKGELPDVTDRRPDVPPRIAEVVRRALERDRERRFATAEELGAAVTEAVADLGGPASAAEVGRYIQAHFSKELAAKQELLALASGAATSPSSSAAAAGAATSAVTAGPSASAATGAASRVAAGGPAPLPQPSDDDEDLEITVARPPRSRARPRPTSGEINLALRAPRSETVPLHPGIARLDGGAPAKVEIRASDAGGAGGAGTGDGDTGRGAGGAGAGDTGDTGRGAGGAPGEGTPDASPPSGGAAAPPPPAPPGSIAAEPASPAWLPVVAIVLAIISVVAAILYWLV